MTFKRVELTVARTSAGATPSLCQAGIAIERSAADRIVVFGAARALKNHEPS